MTLRGSLGSSATVLDRRAQRSKRNGAPGRTDDQLMKKVVTDSKLRRLAAERAKADNARLLAEARARREEK
jgi:hypothetical protein